MIQLMKGTVRISWHFAWEILAVFCVGIIRSDRGIYNIFRYNRFDLPNVLGYKNFRRSDSPITAAIDLTIAIARTNHWVICCNIKKGSFILMTGSTIAITMQEMVHSIVHAIAIGMTGP